MQRKIVRWGSTPILCRRSCTTHSNLFSYARWRKVNLLSLEKSMSLLWIVVAMALDCFPPFEYFNCLTATCCFVICLTVHWVFLSLPTRGRPWTGRTFERWTSTSVICASSCRPVRPTWTTATWWTRKPSSAHSTSRPWTLMTAPGCSRPPPRATPVRPFVIPGRDQVLVGVASVITSEVANTFDIVKHLFRESGISKYTRQTFPEILVCCQRSY